MVWKVNSHLSTRVDGNKGTDDFINWEPGDEVDRFPIWVPVDDWEEAGHIEKIQAKDRPVQPPAKADDVKIEDHPVKKP